MEIPRILEGKKAVVTGGMRGIGRAISLCFAKAGADLLLTTTRDVDTYAADLEELRSFGGRVEAMQLNVSDYNQVNELLPAAVKEFGGADILVNNAGITRDGLMLRMSEKDWDDVISVDLKSAFNTIHSLTPIMMRQRSGSIINITSIVGVLGNAGQCNYAAAKAGLIGLSKSMAKEMGPRGVRTNCIAPGFIDTEMTSSLPEAYAKEWAERVALKRHGKPEDIAGVALFLASELSAFVNGEVIECTGCIL